MGAVFIYSLSCPETGRVRYIGKANDMADRLRSHLRGAAEHQRTPSRKWVKQLLDAGLLPVMAMVQETDTENWEVAEKAVIAQFRATHPDLLNVAGGGAAPYMAQAQRAKNGRLAAKTRVDTPEKAELYLLRTEIGRGLKWHRKNDMPGYERLMQLIRPLVIEYPAIFGTWAGL